jgi:hypothetical protein
VDGSAGGSRCTDTPAAADILKKRKKNFDENTRISADTGYWISADKDGNGFEPGLPDAHP